MFGRQEKGMKDMLERNDFMPINFLKKSPYTGSYRGMRFRMWKEETGDGEEKQTVLRVCHWPEPYGFDHTKAELKHDQDEAFTEAGLLAAIKWLNEVWARDYHEAE